MKISSTPEQLKDHTKQIAESKIETIIEIDDKRKTEKQICAKIKFYEHKASNSSVTNYTRYMDKANALRWVLGACQID